MEQRDDVAACIARLAEADRHLLRELPRLDVPRMSGIYALWVDDELLYIGIARVIQAARTMRGHLNVDKPDQSHLVRKSKE